MAAVVVPGQPKRWGNESTNFYRDSYTENPGVASRQKVYRCTGNQYTNCGHYHLGTKAANLDAPLDKYGSSTYYRLRAEDQRLPKALTTPTVQVKRMSPGQPLNLYQSHQQRYHSYAMASAPVKRSSSEEVGGAEALARSLNKAFYITSYQSDIAKHAARRSSETGASTLCENLQARRNSIGVPPPITASSYGYRRPRPPSAPPIRFVSPQSSKTDPPLLLQRRRSFSAIQRSYPSKGEMLKDIYSAFPSPQPQAVSKRQARPSSAVTLRSGQIPSLRKTDPWV